MDTTFHTKGNRLYKAEKLCSTAAVSRMFECGSSFIAYPLRVVWAESQTAAASSQPAPAVRFMITIPKKRVRRAVKRVLLRRRVREAYRLNRHLIVPALNEAGRHIDVAFIYLDSAPAPYSKISERMQESLARIVEAVAGPQPQPDCDNDTLPTT